MKLLFSFYNLLSFFVFDPTVGLDEGSNFGFFLSVRIVRSSTIRSLVAIKIEKAHLFSPEILG